jgi:recombination protein RecA
MESAAAPDLTFSSAADVAVRRPPASVDSFAIPGVCVASALEIRPALDLVSFGIASLDALTGGVPRGALTEMVGPASSGRTSVMMALMAEVTRRQEVCALVDVTDSFDPASAEAAGVDLKRVLWVRCGKSRSQESGVGSRGVSGGARVRSAVTVAKVAPPAKNISWSIHENYDSRLRHAMVNGGESYKRREAWSVSVPVTAKRNTNFHFAEARRAKWDCLDQALKATDLLLQSGGFGLVIVDLGDIAVEQARRIPLTSWFRFRRAVESTPTILMVLAKDSCAKTCASLVMQLSADARRSGDCTIHEPPTHVSLLDGLNVRVELLRTRLERKPVCSVGASLETRTWWKKTG